MMHNERLVKGKQLLNNESLIKIPAREFGPAPWYAWMGNPTEKSIDEDLKRGGPTAPQDS